MAKIELTWTGKSKSKLLKPHVLCEDPDLGCSATIANCGIYDNMLIHGDNMLAMSALEQEFASKVKCIYIDPPYNTGNAFRHYDDDAEHSLWLSLMRSRMVMLRNLLAPDAMLFVSIDDHEAAYLRILLDEIFGRSNYCGSFVWEKKKKPSFLQSNMAVVTEYVLAYAKDRRHAPALTYGKTTRGKKYPINNAGNGVRTISFQAGSVIFKCRDKVFEPQDMSGGKIITRLLDRLEIRDGRNTKSFRLEGEWRYSQKRIDSIIDAGEEIVIAKAPFRPNHIKAGGRAKKVKNLLSRESYGLPTYEDATVESRALFGTEAAFDYPKPEGLIEFLLEASTSPGDLVLDCFAGSGTTGAVAHKMGRRWIMVEIGAQTVSHIIPRLRKVVEGKDPGGVTDLRCWKGGGGFRFYRLVDPNMEDSR